MKKECLGNYGRVGICIWDSCLEDLQIKARQGICVSIEDTGDMGRKKGKKNV